MPNRNYGTLYICNTGYSFEVRQFGKAVSPEYLTYEEALEDLQSR